MRRSRSGWVVAVAAAVAVVGGGARLLAQPRGAPAERGPASAARLESPPGGPPAPSVQEALLRPIRLPFAGPTALEAVAEYLRRQLNAPVVLDVAALERLELTPEDTVQLDLEGVRLKVGLKLLLDQVGMTFRVEPEDNLLILTDAEGSGDPIEQLRAEVHSLHRDVHDLQDAVDDVLDALGVGADAGPAIQTPTIIEPAPPEGSTRPSRSRPG